MARPKLADDLAALAAIDKILEPFDGVEATELLGNAMQRLRRKLNRGCDPFHAPVTQLATPAIDAPLASKPDPA